MSFKSDDDVYCRICCFLKQKGLKTDKFTLDQVVGSFDEFKFSKWIYDIDRPTDGELAGIPLDDIKRMKKIQSIGRISKITVLSQEEIYEMIFEEGDFIYNSTEGFLQLFTNGIFIQV